MASASITVPTQVPLGLARKFSNSATTSTLSASMLRSVGCRYCIVGHSERRQYYQEGDGDVARKVDQALANDLYPIICVGETLDERHGGHRHQPWGARQWLRREW